MEKPNPKPSDISAVLTTVLGHAKRTNLWASSDAVGGGEIEAQFAPVSNRHGEYELLGVRSPDGAEIRGVLRLQTHYVFGHGRLMLDPLGPDGRLLPDGQQKVYNITQSFVSQNGVAHAVDSAWTWLRDHVLRALKAGQWL